MHVTRSLLQVHGITMIELMVVTVILGIAAQVVNYNALDLMPKYKLNSATRHVVTDLMAARMQAIKQSEDVLVTFSDPHTYAIGPDLNHNGVLDGSEGKTTDLQARYGTLSFSTPLPPTLTFNAKGTLSSTPKFTITNKSGMKQIILSIIGHVKVS
jgi:type IV fimbrial biogenesis protein FimT